MAEFLSCRELVELITDYLEEVLPPAWRSAFEEHLAICPPCRGYLLEIRGTAQAARSLREDDIPQETRELLLAVFREWKTKVP